MIFLNGLVIKKQSQLLKLEDDILIKNSHEIIRIKVKSFAEKREGYEKAKFLYKKKSSIITDLVKNKTISLLWFLLLFPRAAEKIV